MISLKETLRRSVNSRCACGGNGPGSGCPACEVWHDLQDRLKTYETGFAELVEVADNAACWLFTTFSFGRTRVAQEGLELHDDLIAALITATEEKGE